MADVTATDVLHQMKQTEKGDQDEHREALPAAQNGNDLEKHASHGAGYDLSHLPMDDGEYVVTAKTWAVRHSTRSVIWHILLASTILQHDPVRDGSFVRIAGDVRHVVCTDGGVECSSRQH